MSGQVYATLRELVAVLQAANGSGSATDWMDAPVTFLVRDHAGNVEAVALVADPWRCPRAEANQHQPAQLNLEVRLDSRRLVKRK